MHECYFEMANFCKIFCDRHIFQALELHSINCDDFICSLSLIIFTVSRNWSQADHALLTLLGDGSDSCSLF